MRAGYDDMALQIKTQEDTIVRLEKELQQAHDDIAQRDAMVADMMRRQGEALSQQEVQGLNGGEWARSVGGVECWRCRRWSVDKVTSCLFFITDSSNGLFPPSQLPL